MEAVKIQFDGYPEDFVREYTQAHNLKFLDSGAFGSVYTYRGSQHRRRVVKAIILQTKDADDDGYLAYFKQVILKQQDNPFVPRIYNIEAYRFVSKLGSEHLVYFIEMERLHCAKMHLVRRLLKKTLPRSDYVYNQNEGFLLLSLNDLLTAAVTSQNKHFRRLSKNILWLLVKFRNDLHLGNMMLRRKGRGHQLVITDPIV